MSKVTGVLKRVWNVVASEPAVVAGVVVAAVNTATDKTWKGYVVAVGLALFRFAVSPALPTVK
jgi:hypothetical protein